MSHYKPYPAYKDSGVEWLGRVPEHWAVTKIGRTLLEPPCYGVLVPDFEMDGVPMLRITDMEHEKIDKSGLVTISHELSAQYSRTIVRQGDVVLSVVGTIGKSFAVSEQLAGCNLSRAVARIQPSDKISPSYLCKVFESSAFTRFVDLTCLGSAQRVLNMGDLSGLLFCIPAVEEQTAICAHLDRETARIDALVAKKTRFIELLREKRQALITHAVTKGLDPSVKMKDSGVEWLGEVPEHWETMSLTRVTVARCDGPFGSAIKSENYTDSGVRVIRLQNIGIGEFKDGDQAFLSPEYRAEVIGHSHDVEPGDLLIAGLGDENNPLGRTCVAPSSLGDAIVKADCYRFRTDRSRALPAFLALQLSATARVECGFISTGSTRERLNLGLAASRVIALPPSTDEQSAIVERAARATARLDDLLSKTEHSIELLKERRSALITAAVTGQIDLREHH